jgi:hypothetical protein
MRMNNFFKTVGPFVALAAMGAIASGCTDKGFRWEGKSEGVPLAELDLTGEAPEGVALMGPDTVAITDGAKFAVTVDGEAADRMRFTLEDGTLGITRERGEWNDNGTATVHITMPAPRKLVVAGSGRMTSERLAGKAEVAVAGSGTLETPAVDAISLEVSIAGSGSYSAAGRAGHLELSIAGSGSGDMAKLKAEGAEINIAGSGNAEFASDGDVEANIMGSGNVTVRGSARCKVHSMGSGSLTCERETEAAD